MSHNIPLLRDIYSRPDFIDGTFNTSFFATTYPEGLKLKPLEGLNHKKLLCIAAMVRLRREQWNRQWVGADANFTDLLDRDKFYISFNEQEFTPISVKVYDRVFEASTGDWKLKFESDWQIGDSFVKANFDDDVEPFICHYLKATNGHELIFGGNVFRTKIRIEAEHQISEDLAISNYINPKLVIKSPMPGKVISISCKLNSRVKKGEEICVIEAMKMQNIIKSPFAGIISQINVQIGDSVSTGQVILEYQTS